MLRFGFDFERLEKDGLVQVLDLEGLKGDGLSANLEFIIGQVDSIGAKRLVIDSWTALLSACPGKFEYRFFMHLAYKMLKARTCTTLMTCSIPSGATSLGLGVEEFVADAVLELQSVVEGLEMKTRFLVRKMRGTDHSRRYFNVSIGGQGLEIIPYATT